MPHDEILSAIVTAVTQIQKESQRDLPPLHGDSRLIGDVPGCDSLVVVEVSIILSEILEPVLRGREIPDCILQGAGKDARPTLNEIASSIQDFINQDNTLRTRITKKASGHSEAKLATTGNTNSNGSNGYSEKVTKALVTALKSVSSKVDPSAS